MVSHELRQKVEIVTVTQTLRNDQTSQ